MITTALSERQVFNLPYFQLLFRKNLRKCLAAEPERLVLFLRGAFEGLCADRICHAPVTVSGLFDLWPLSLPHPSPPPLHPAPPPLPTFPSLLPPPTLPRLLTAECIWELSGGHGLLREDWAGHRQPPRGPERRRGGGTDVEGKRGGK